MVVGYQSFNMKISGGALQLPRRHGFGHGASLEQLVLANSKQYFKNYGTIPDARERWKNAAEKIVNKKIGARNKDEADDGNSGCCNRKFCWWVPDQDSISVAFCNETSIHGLRFLGQVKRHLTERIFWVAAFMLSLGAAIFLIYGVLEKYINAPVIVSFQTNEQGIDSIPFPAVTLCNMNRFPKRKVEELEKIVKNTSHKDYEAAKLELTYVKRVCSADESFAKTLGFAFSRGDSIAINTSTVVENQADLVEFILENTMRCGEMLRLCVLGEEKRNCSDLFKPIMTDFGKCCTFNILPLPLLLRNPDNKENDSIIALYDNPMLGKNAAKNWPVSEIKEWQNWNSEDGFVLGGNITRPWKQRRAGLPYGLSVLVDPNVAEYYCPATDSLGMRYILHTPLEMPHVTEFASSADLEKEILVEVHPDMTNADDDIREIDPKKRECFFGKERKLEFFGPYTSGNCIDECTSKYLNKNCGCAYFHMPRKSTVRICSTDRGSKDHTCIENARIELQKKLDVECGDCANLCDDIAYNYETPIADLQPNKNLWGDVEPTKSRPIWWSHEMAIVHVFFGSETTVPRYRKRLYGVTDLIANTGGILGLCLGFSILSGVEVFYFATIRSMWKYCRRRMIGRRVANKFTQAFKSRHRHKVIRRNPNMIPVYPEYAGNQSVFQGGKMHFVPNIYGTGYYRY